VLFVSGSQDFQVSAMDGWGSIPSSASHAASTTAYQFPIKLGHLSICSLFSNSFSVAQNTYRQMKG